MTNKIFFGVETIPNPLLVAKLGLDLDDPEQALTASTTSEYCRIIALAYAVNGEQVQVMKCDTEEEESQALQHLWNLFAMSDQIVGYNCLGFDIPVVKVRSIMLGVTNFIDLTNLKPWENRVLDLQKKRFPAYGAIRQRDLCTAYGIDYGQVYYGEDIYKLWQDENYHEILKHVECDVEELRALHDLFNGYFF